MKYLVAAIVFAQASAFTFVSKPRAETRLFEYEPMDGEGKINLKVSDHQEGEKKVSTNVRLTIILQCRSIWIPRRLLLWMTLRRARKFTADAGCLEPSLSAMEPTRSITMPLVTM